MALATRPVPWTRDSSSSRLTFPVQRRWAAMLTPARCTTASALARSSGSSWPALGSQRTWSGSVGSERVRRSTWWPASRSRRVRAVPISPEAPVTATSMARLLCRRPGPALPSRAAGRRLRGAGRQAATVPGLGAGPVAPAGQKVAGQLEAGHALAESGGQRLGQALGAVEDDHLVDRPERLGRGLHDRRPLLGQLLADDGVLVLGQGVGPGLDRLGLGHALGLHGLA